MKTFAILAGLLWATEMMACGGEVDEMRLIPEVAGSIEGYAKLGGIGLSEPFDLDLTFCGGDAQAIRRIEVSAIMPAHQHGMNYAPLIVPKEDGQFKVSNMLFHMHGEWELQVSVFTV